ncbi:MAG: exosome protein [Thermoprotei archaeon]|nr:exosome protein [Thermoprotei archaeon]
MVDLVESIHIEAFVHATESRNKVLKAMLTFIPEELRSSLKISEYKVKGHYGNPIRILRVYIRKNSESVAKYIASLLSDDDKRILLTTLNDRIGNGNKLYLRFDKQYALLGKLKLSHSGSVIKVVISFKRNVELREACKQVGLIS